MKKYLFIATAAITVLAGCNKFSFTPDQNNQVEIDDTTPAYIQLGTQLPEVAVKTKAAVTGTSFAADDKLVVIGKVVGTEGAIGTAPTSPAHFVDAAAKIAGDNKTITLSTDYAQYADGQIYTFYSYFAGRESSGTGVATITAPTDLATDDLSEVAVTLPDAADADVMVAAANAQIDFETVLDGGTEVRGITMTNYTDYVYGAKAARRGIQPSLKFKHALTSLAMKLKSGNAESNTLEITSITVNAAKTGTLNLVNCTATGATPEETDQITFTKDAGFALAAHDAEAASYGDPVMLFPGTEEYTVTITFSNGTTTTAKFKSNETGEKFEAGRTYVATAKVYGPTNIVITTSIEEWAKGTDPDVYDPDAIN